MNDEAPLGVTESELKQRAPEVPGEWLTQFSSTDEAARLAQMQADGELLERVMWAGYKGVEYDQLEDRLIRYGYQVLRVWLANGEIFRKCGDKGRKLWATNLSSQKDEATGLAGETVVYAVRKFRMTVLVPGIWKPDGRASLDTFFIGQCLLRFPNVYRRWLNESGLIGADAMRDTYTRKDLSLDGPLLHLQLRAADGNPEAVVNRAAYLALAPDAATARILEFVEQGFSYAEIALLTGIPVGAVRSRLYRLRRSTKVKEFRGGASEAG